MGSALNRVHLGGRGRSKVLGLLVWSPELFQRGVELLVAQGFWASHPTGKLQSVVCVEVLLTQVHACSDFVRGFWSRSCTSVVGCIKYCTGTSSLLLNCMIQVSQHASSLGYSCCGKFFCTGHMDQVGLWTS